MSTKPNSSTLNTNIESRSLEVIDNTNEIAVKIGLSRARLIYKKFFKTTSGGTVLSFAGISISCLTTLLTSTFKDISGIDGSAAVLTAIYALLTLAFGIISVIWLCKWIYSLIKLNENAFINELKGSREERGS